MTPARKPCFQCIPTPFLLAWDKTEVVCDMGRKNLIGRRVAQLRYERDWTQEDLSDRLFDAGWPLSRSEVSKLEGGRIHVYEFQLLYLAEVFSIAATDLLPQRDPNQPVHETLLKDIHQRPAAGEATEQAGTHFFFRRPCAKVR